MRIGTRVVCIDDTFPDGVGPQGITAGQQCTVSWYGRHSHPIDGDYMGVRLAELQRGADPGAYCDDLPFRADRFRPVVSPKNERVLEVAE